MLSFILQFPQLKNQIEKHNQELKNFDEKIKSQILFLTLELELHLIKLQMAYI